MNKTGLTIFFLLIVLAGTAQEIFQKEFYFDNDSSKLKEVIHFTTSDSTLHGSYESFHHNGSLQTFGFYHMGIPDSIWVYYFENGRKRAQGKFKNGMTDGKWIYYFENGSKKSEGILREDIKHGTWNFYYENEHLKSTGTYLNDEKSGIWNYFYEDDLIKAQAYFEEGMGNYREFYPTGGVKMEGPNNKDKSEGDWVYYYETGEVQAKGQFENGLRIGEWTYYHTSGKISAVGRFSDGEEEGVWKHYFEDGSVSAEGAMESGEKDGFWKLYYPTGELKGEGEYVVGDGEYIEYYPNGTRRTNGRIKNSQKYGKWIFYTEEGLVDGQAVFNDGEGLYEGFYPDGTLKMKGMMRDDKRIGEWQLYNPDGALAGTYRPIYENDSPIFKTRESRKLTDPEGSDKPDYLFKNNRLRYFTPIINEYEGVILGGNPLEVVFNQFPIALEYYYQERLGYELQFILHRDPFFKSLTDANLDEVFTRGGTFEFRQKFYHPDRKYGMWYFGHQLGFTYLTHSTTTLDNNFFEVFGRLSESRLYYGVTIGSRWMQRFADSGFTMDGYVGLGAGIRSYTTNYSSVAGFENAFDAQLKGRGYFPVLIGLNIGFVGPKRRLSK
jgi:antitoxin component YwqK of YwqJK toxin-antitoxin module